jgi:hypothetical protein
MEQQRQVVEVAGDIEVFGSVGLLVDGPIRHRADAGVAEERRQEFTATITGP